MEEVLRKYIRYALNEKPFNPDMVSGLIQLRKASLLDDSQVAEILNEISRRIVRDKGKALNYYHHNLYDQIVQYSLFHIKIKNLIRRLGGEYIPPPTTDCELQKME